MKKYSGMEKHGFERKTNLRKTDSQKDSQVDSKSGRWFYMKTGDEPP